MSPSLDPRRWFAGLFFVAAGAIGCASPSAPVKESPPAPVPAPAGDTVLMSMVDQLGDAAMVVAVLDFRTWDSVYPFLTKHAGIVEPGLAAQVAKYKTPKALVESIIGDGGVEFDRSGFDYGRPVVAGLSAPVVNGPLGVSASMAPLGESTIPGHRHEILLPATDAKGLAASLSGLLDQIGKRHGAAWAVGKIWVGLRADGDVVRLAVVTGRWRPPSAGKDEVPLWPTNTRRPARTPAYAALTRGGAPLALLLRPWHIRAAGSAAGLSSLMDALQYSAPDKRLSLMAMGASLVLSAEPMMLARRPEYDDHAISVRLSKRGMTFDMVSSVTPAGREVHAAAVEKVVRYPLKIKTQGDVFMGIDVRAALAKAQPRAEFTRMGADDDLIFRAFQECGIWCPMHMFSRAPWSSTRALTDAAGPSAGAVLAMLPRSIQAAVLTPKAPNEQPAFAVVAEVAPDFDISQVEPLLAGMHPAKPELERKSIGDRTLLLIGVGVKAEAVFDLNTPEKDAPILRVHIGPEMAKMAADLGPPVTKPVMAALHSWTLESKVAPNGKSLEWRWDVATDPTPAPPSAAYADLTWDSPLGHAKAPKEDCVAAALQQARDAFGTLAHAAPTQHLPEPLMVRALDGLEPQLQCAAGDAATKDAAIGIRRQLVSIIAIAHAMAPAAGNAALMVQQCARSKDPWICDKAKALGTAVPSGGSSATPVAPGALKAPPPFIYFQF